MSIKMSGTETLSGCKVKSRGSRGKLGISSTRRSDENWLRWLIVDFLREIPLRYQRNGINNGVR